MRVIMRARQPADDPRGDAGLRAQQSLQREAHDNHRLTWFDRNVTAQRRRGGDRLRQAEDREIIRRVGCNQRRLHRFFVAHDAQFAAAVDDVIVGQDDPGLVDDKSGAARTRLLAAR